MGEKTLNIRIKNKYDTEANWTKNNPILLAGETAYSSDKSGKYKIGDGTHKWSELSYAKADLVKSDVTTALGYTPPTNNTWRGIQNNLTSDSATDSLAAAQGKVLKGLVDGKLPLSGGTMTGTAMISWPDSGNWNKNNANVTFPVNRGGLSWSGQSDGIQLYAVETGHDNLELYLKFTDDNSNGLSIRNKDNTQTARISATGEITASNFVGNLNGTASAAPWSGITGKPTSYPPSSHTHNYAGSSSAGGNAYNANALYVNPSTRQASANYDLTNNAYAYRVTYSIASSAMTTGKPPSDAHILTFGWDSNAGWGAQLCIGDAKNNHLYLRGSSSVITDNKASSSWENWKTVLDSTNYNVYTPTKTGGGASGTWGISVTGNAATATKLATARSINGTNFDGSGNITTATWGTARNVTIGSTKKSVNGGADVSWSLSEIGAAAASHSHSYLPLSGGTMTGALNFANATWNIVGDDVYIGDMNIGGTLGVMGKNGNTTIKLVQYGASTTSGSGAPGVSWTCTGANASTMSGTLSGTFSGNLSGTASRATLLAPAYTADTFSTASSTWRNGVTEGKVVWGQSWRDTSMSNDTGDLTIWIKQNESVTTANMTIDGTINAIGGFIGSLSGNASSATALTSSAGSATQPVYFSGGKPVACSYTLGKSVPADAKFTDTNTWRGVQNNLTSTATDQSLSAAQGKVLNEKKMSAVSANGYYGMARPDNNTSDWIRTTTNGLLPVQSGGRGSGHSSLGTSSWYFSQAYIDHVYTTDVKIADKVTLQYDSTNTCLNFVFS